GKSPLGRKSPGDSATIVGVVANVAPHKLESKPVPEVYRPFAQSPLGRFRLVIRSSGDMTALASAVRGAMRAIDPDQPIYEVMTMDERLAGAVAPRRMNMILLGSFAGLAMLLSAVGIYG